MSKKTEGKFLSKEALREITTRALAKLIPVPVTETGLWKALNKLYYEGEIEGEYPESLEDEGSEYFRYYRDSFVPVSEAISYLKALKEKVSKKDYELTIEAHRRELHAIVSRLKELDGELEKIHEDFNVRHLDLEHFELGEFVDEIGWNSSTRSC